MSIETIRRSRSARARAGAGSLTTGTRPGLNRFTRGPPLRYDPGAYGPARPRPHSARRPVPGSPAVRRPSHAGVQPLVDVAPPCRAALQPAGAEHLVALSKPGGPALDRDQLEAARRRRELHRRVPRRDGGLRTPVSYTHLRAHETRHDLVCRLL